MHKYYDHLESDFRLIKPHATFYSELAASLTLQLNK
jgi:hypothetical protein